MRMGRRAGWPHPLQTEKEPREEPGATWRKKSGRLGVEHQFGAKAPACLSIRQRCGDFPGGAVVKNPPANAGDTGSIPGPGRPHMPRSN